MKIDKIRPALLSSNPVRGNLSEDVPEFRHVMAAIDRLGDLHEGLAAIRGTSDSRVTREARAERYAEQLAAAKGMKAKIINNVRHDLNARRDRLRNAAIEKSGLNGNYPQAEEVRSVLRSLSKEERDKAINEAVDNGDAWIVAAFVKMPDLLTGKTSLSKAQLTDIFIKRATPELDVELDAIDTAFESLKLAEDTFDKHVEAMRDIEAENRANEDRRAVEEAEAAFAKAMGTTPPGAA